MEPIEPLETAAAKFDRARLVERAAQAEAERKELVSRFPLEAWPILPLEKYALGHEKSQDSFCRWLEFNTPNVAGMRGGNAGKHLLYKHAKKPGWYFDQTYQNVESAWQALRAGFVEAFEKAQDDNWDAIDDIEALAGGHALRSKALYCYFPDALLPISSLGHLTHFVQRVKPAAFDPSLGVIRLNRTLLAAVRQMPCFQGWTNWEIVVLLYEWADPRDSRRIVKIAPGELGKYWDDCLANGYICVGWDKVGDLRDYESKEDFVDRFREIYDGDIAPSKLKEKASELWTLMELEPGDIVVANKGTSEILAIGEVLEPSYDFLSEREEYNHTVRVNWDTSYATTISPQKRWAFVTVGKCPVEVYQKIIGKHAKPVLMPIDPLHQEIGNALRRKGQAILYGPPGTGKTYAARRAAVLWLLQQAGETDAQAIVADPKQFREAERALATVQVSERVWWMVANPKEWDWSQLRKEKTVEYRYGRLQRNYPLVQPGDLVIGYQSTPDKRIVALARVSRELAKNAQGEPTIELRYLHDVENGLTYEELMADPVLSQSEPLKFRNQGTLFALDPEEASQALGLLTDRDPQVAKFLEVEGRVGQLTWLTFHGSYSYEDFIEGFRPVKSTGGLTLRLEDGVFKRICREAQANPDRPYLVLIDEFNRANVAKVFGELITLLELDKRGLAITLPQSKESFTIPPNVFVLGTMNTADRSIKLLDSAMRRRFAFIELMPDSELIRGSRIQGLELGYFLEQLNARIAEQVGREKQIGHSFLMEDGQPVSDPEEFLRRFRQEILPLLQEYCYDDYGALAHFLGNKLVDGKAQTLSEDHFADADALLAVLEEEFAQAAGAEA